MPVIEVKKYIIAGLLVWLPLAITIWVLAWIVGVLDGVFQALVATAAAVLPESAQKLLDTLAHVPGLGVLLLLLLMMLTGMFVTNIVGQWWIQQWDRLLSKIPIINRFFTNRSMVKEEQTLLILMKPTILIQNEEEETAFPGLLDKLKDPFQQ